MGLFQGNARVRASFGEERAITQETVSLLTLVTAIGESSLQATLRLATGVRESPHFGTG